MLRIKLKLMLNVTIDDNSIGESEAGGYDQPCFNYYNKQVQFYLYL